MSDEETEEGNFKIWTWRRVVEGIEGGKGKKKKVILTVVVDIMLYGGSFIISIVLHTLLYICLGQKICH